MSDIKKSLPEGDGTDPLTLTNLILAHDARTWGYNWVHQQAKRSKTAEEIFDEAPAEVDKVGGFVLDPPASSPVKIEEAKKKMKKNISKKSRLKKTAPAPPADSPPHALSAAADMGGTPFSPVTPAHPGEPVEANHLNPAIVSSDPQFNPCPAYLNNVCRVDGRPCPYSAIDYKECGKYYLASSGDPELFEIMPGRETSPEYQLGLKA
jgi:hypothetical protein